MATPDSPTLAAPRAPVARQDSWQDQIQDWVQRTVSRPGFRRWAAGFWLTRPLVRRRAGDLFDLVAGFVYTQVLLACVRLDLFNRLAASGPETVAALALRHGLPPRSMQRLLDAAVSLRLLATRRGGRYGLGTLGAPMVGNEGLAAMVEHHAALYADLRDPVALQRVGVQHLFNHHRLRSRHQCRVLGHGTRRQCIGAGVGGRVCGIGPVGRHRTARAFVAQQRHRVAQVGI